MPFDYKALEKDDDMTSLDEIKTQLDRIEALLGKGGAPVKQQSSGGGQTADDRTFAGQYANFKISIDPKAWSGPSLQGKTASEAPTDWLMLAAQMYDAFGERAEAEGKLGKNGKPSAWMDFQKSALCRRWAEEKRKGNVPDTDSDGVPF